MKTNLKVNTAYVWVVLLSLLLGACSAPSLVPVTSTAKSTAGLELFPNWYHDSVGYQIKGGQRYPDQPALAKLLMDADKAFLQDDLIACQTLLERAQRIGTRETSVYVRLSYLYWVQQKPALAEQMARRALAVLGSDVQQKQAVAALLQAIQAN